MLEFERHKNRPPSNYLVRPAGPDRAEQRLPAAPPPLLARQQSLGNQAVQHLLRSGMIQAKVKINEPGDRYEQEADRVADAVIRMPDPGTAATKEAAVPGQDQSIRIQRMCTECEEELHRQPLEEEGAVLGQIQAPIIQRVCSECEEELHRQPMEEDAEETLQPKEGPGRTPGVMPGAQVWANALRSGGQPLPRAVRAFFEPRFGHDFSQVRIHTDARAAESARAVNAAAYTVGRDMVFDAGHYAPEIASGRALLAHELVHVVQQGESRESAGVGHIDGEATVRRQAVSVPVTEYRFAAEGVSVLVRTSCAGPNYGHATVEAAVRDALDKVFNTDCIAVNRRRQIQRNLRTNGLDLICRRSASIGGNCARGEGFFTPANQIALGSKGFPGHPDYDTSGGCDPLASTILHEIIHITRGTYPEALPSSCEASCYGVGSADPALCRGPVTPPSPVPVGFESSQMELV
jgi:hypothetical protein